jgi:hypothetical protein
MGFAHVTGVKGIVFMIHRAFLGLTMTCLALAVASCSKGISPQSMALDANTNVILEDAWIYAFGSSNQLLRTRFVFEGSDPNRTYELKAALRADKTGEDIRSTYVWHTGLPPDPTLPTNQVAMIWEFKEFPTNTPYIYLREYFVDKASGRVARFLDFVLPGTRHLRLRDASVK